MIVLARALMRTGALASCRSRLHRLLEAVLVWSKLQRSGLSRYSSPDCTPCCWCVGPARLARALSPPCGMWLGGPRLTVRRLSLVLCHFSLPPPTAPPPRRWRWVAAGPRRGGPGGCWGGAACSGRSAPTGLPYQRREPQQHRGVCVPANTGEWWATSTVFSAKPGVPNAPMLV